MDKMLIVRVLKYNPVWGRFFYSAPDVSLFQAPKTFPIKNYH